MSPRCYMETRRAGPCGPVTRRDREGVTAQTWPCEGLCSRRDKAAGLRIPWAGVPATRSTSTQRWEVTERSGERHADGLLLFV